MGCQWTCNYRDTSWLSPIGLKKDQPGNILKPIWKLKRVWKSDKNLKTCIPEESSYYFYTSYLNPLILSSGLWLGYTLTTDTWRRCRKRRCQCPIWVSLSLITLSSLQDNKHRNSLKHAWRLLYSILSASQGFVCTQGSGPMHQGVPSSRKAQHQVWRYITLSKEALMLLKPLWWHWEAQNDQNV